MKEIHILVTGVGRRVELMQAFRQAALNLNINLKLYGADMAGTAPALMYCDYTRKVCSMRDKEYVQQLIDICVADKIDLLLLGAKLSSIYKVPHIWYIQEMYKSHYQLSFLKKNQLDYMNDHSQQFIAISNTVANDWINNGILKEKVTTVYNGIEG